MIDHHQAWSEARRVLCVRLDALGDVLMTSPAMRALKEGRPGRHVTLLTSPGGAAAAELLPEIDEVIVYDAPWMKATAPRVGPLVDLQLIERLRAGWFDAAAIFTVFSQSPLPAALTCFLAEVPLRLAHCRESPYQLLTDWVPETEPEQGPRHEVRRQLDLAAAVGGHTADERIRLRVPAVATEQVRQLLAGLGLDEDAPWAVVHVGASAPSRRYPPELFAEVVRGLAEKWIAVVFTGSPDEVPLIEQVRGFAGAFTHSLAGELTLAELAALLARAPVLVSNNTGPVHLACGVGTPVVDLYALTNPQHTPWGVPHRVLNFDVPCKNCFKSVCPQGHHDCLQRIPPAEVVRAACELLRMRQGLTECLT